MSGQPFPFQVREAQAFPPTPSGRSSWRPLRNFCALCGQKLLTAKSAEKHTQSSQRKQLTAAAARVYPKAAVIGNSNFIIDAMGFVFGIIWLVAFGEGVRETAPLRQTRRNALARCL